MCSVPSCVLFLYVEYCYLILSYSNWKFERTFTNNYEKEQVLKFNCIMMKQFVRLFFMGLRFHTSMLSAVYYSVEIDKNKNN